MEKTCREISLSLSFFLIDILDRIHGCEKKKKTDSIVFLKKVLLANEQSPFQPVKDCSGLLWYVCTHIQCVCICMCGVGECIFPVFALPALEARCPPVPSVLALMLPGRKKNLALSVLAVL